MKKALASTDVALELPFKMDSIATVAAPAGAAGTWFSYVISQGENRIAGMRAGTHAEVTTHVHDLIERLNDRRAGKTRPRSKA